MSGSPIRTVTNIVTLTPVSGATTTAYAAGQVMGAAYTLAGAVLDPGGTGHVVSVAATIQRLTALAFSIHLFKGNPNLTAASDRVTLTVADVDMEANYLGTIDMTTTDFKIGNNNAFGFTDRAHVPIQAATGATYIFGVAVAQHANTLSGSEVVFKLGIIAD